MNENPTSPAERMKGYLQKVAAGPKMSKDLSAEEAEDGLRLVLDDAVSKERQAVFLIATRMKLETVEENIGFFRALDATTEKRNIQVPELLQITEAFDGFQRQPAFGFFVPPVLAEMGLPTFGLSSLPHPPKFGITFEDLLVNHYKINRKQGLDQAAKTITEFGFGYLSTAQCHPKLEALRKMRVEIVKRPMLATLEKMLQPLSAEKNFLSSNYFHPGYEVSMLAVAKESGFDRVIIGNGMEGTTLFGVHKLGKVFTQDKHSDAFENKVDTHQLLDARDAEAIRTAFEQLKSVVCERDTLAELGEAALNGENNPATIMIAVHAALLFWLAGKSDTARDALGQALDVLSKGNAGRAFQSFIAQ